MGPAQIKPLPPSTPRVPSQHASAQYIEIIMIGHRLRDCGAIARMLSKWDLEYTRTSHMTPPLLVPSISRAAANMARYSVVDFDCANSCWNTSEAVLARWVTSTARSVYSTSGALLRRNSTASRSVTTSFIILANRLPPIQSRLSPLSTSAAIKVLENI